MFSKRAAIERRISAEMELSIRVDFGELDSTVMCKWVR